MPHSGRMPSSSPRLVGITVLAVLLVGALGPLGAVAASAVEPRDDTRASSNSVAGTWGWPTDTGRDILRQFEAPATRYSAGHRGVDIAAPEGTMVLAAASGVVSFAGVVVDRPVVSITSPGGLVSSAEPVLATVEEGDEVHAGDTVGTVAVGGHCSGSCVHFGVRLYGEYVNPLALMGSVPRAVLLPLGR